MINLEVFVPTETHRIGNQLFDFESDDDTITVHKYEEREGPGEVRGRDNLGTVMLYVDQIDDLIGHLQRLKKTLVE